MTEQISRVIARVSFVRSAVRALVEPAEATAWHQVVRYFDAADGEEEAITVKDDLEKLSGQHRLLGWHLSAETLDFVREVHAEIDVDEYG